MSLNYWKTTFKKDFIAGLVVTVLIIPQGIAYAILAGLPPEIGLYTATVPILIYLLFGSSRHLSVGPVAMVSLLVYSGVSVHALPGTNEYVSLVLTLSLLVGALQLFFAFCRLGTLVELVPYSVIKGFTSACAILIAFSQLEHLLGISLGHSLGVQYILLELFEEFHSIHLQTVAIGILSMCIILFFNKLIPTFPIAIFVVVFCTLLVHHFQLDQYGVSVIGVIPEGMPYFSFASLNIQALSSLFPLAIVIAFISYVESVAVGAVIAKKENYPLSLNKELRGLGLANLTASLFAAMPVAGGISRSAVNYDSGAQTKMAGVITTLFIIFTLLFFTPLFYFLPKATLAAIIMVAVLRLIHVKELYHLALTSSREALLVGTTVASTLVLGPEWGILFGCLLAVIAKVSKFKLIYLYQKGEGKKGGM